MTFTDPFPLEHQFLTVNGPQVSCKYATYDWHSCISAYPAQLDEARAGATQRCSPSCSAVQGFCVHSWRHICSLRTNTAIVQAVPRSQSMMVLDVGLQAACSVSRPWQGASR